jgi:hypothetical protein
MHSALCQAGGLLKHLIDNLDGKNGEEWLEILRRALRRQNPFELPQPDFDTAFVLEMRSRNFDEVFAQLRTHLFGISDRYLRASGGEGIFFGGIPFDQHIVLVTPAQLGVRTLMGNASDLAHLWVRAEEFGLKPCLPATAPLAVLQHPDWFASREYVYFASRPFEDEKVWYTHKHNGKVTLDTCPAALDTEVFPDEQWAFWLPNG